MSTPGSPPGPAIALLATLLLAASGCGPAAPRGVILISIDTLRADHLGCYGAERPTSPNLDRLAEGGTVFEQAWTTSPWTLPSHASLLTGMYPEHHGVRSRDDALPRDVATLTTALRLHGVATGGVVNAIWLGRYFGLDRSFLYFREFSPDHSAEGAAGRISESGLAWLDTLGTEPFFLFLHYFDVHTDYRSLDAFESLFVERQSEAEGSTEHVQGLRALGRSTPDEIERLESLYDAGIRQLDAELGRLFDRLRDRDLLGDVWVVVTADHGEEFYDHGSFGHGHALHEELLHVPLIFHGPGVPRGRRIPEPVSLVDVAPTILGALGAPPVEALDGIDLARLWRGGKPPERALFAGATRWKPASLQSVRRGDLKLILPDEGAPRLYDLAADPGERNDRTTREPERVEEFRRLLEVHRAGRIDGDRAVRLPRAEAEQLRALGYAE